MALLTNLTTDIGDSLVLGGVVVIGSLYLFGQGCRKSAGALLFSLLGSALLIALAKLLFLGCGEPLKNNYNLHSPSGHSALSVAVLGTYAFIIMSQLRGMWRFIPVLLFTPLILAIAITRIVLNFHSISEVIVGLIIGSLVLLLCCLSLGRKKEYEKFSVYRFVIYTLLIAVVLHGFHLPAENFIQYIASHIPTHVTICAR